MPFISLGMLTKSSKAVGTARHRFRLLVIISVLLAMEDELVAVLALAPFSLGGLF